MKKSDERLNPTNDEMVEQARAALQPEGIVILGQYRSHAAIALKLGIPVPRKGESISIRLASAEAMSPGVVSIDGGLWRTATPQDPIVRAPTLPRV